MSRYESIFVGMAIERLHTLNDEDLTNMGVRIAGHRKRLLIAISILNESDHGGDDQHLGEAVVGGQVLSISPLGSACESQCANSNASSGNFSDDGDTFLRWFRKSRQVQHVAHPDRTCLPHKAAAYATSSYAETVGSGATQDDFVDDYDRDKPSRVATPPLSDRTPSAAPINIDDAVHRHLKPRALCVAAFLCSCVISFAFLQNSKWFLLTAKFTVHAACMVAFSCFFPTDAHLRPTGKGWGQRVAAAAYGLALLVSVKGLREAWQWSYYYPTRTQGLVHQIFCTQQVGGWVTCFMLAMMGRLKWNAIQLHAAADPAFGLLTLFSLLATEERGALENSQDWLSHSCHLKICQLHASRQGPWIELAGYGIAMAVLHAIVLSPANRRAVAHGTGLAHVRLDLSEILSETLATSETRK